jgi:hypothetical protein
MRHLEVDHVFLGSKRHLMQRVFTERNQPLHRMVKPMRLGSIEDERFSAFIRERFSSTSVAIDEEASGYHIPDVFLRAWISRLTNRPRATSGT